MTQRYTPVWDDREPIEILTKRVGFPAEVVGEFLAHPDEGHQGSQRSFVIIYPADSEEGQAQENTVARVLFGYERRWDRATPWEHTTERVRTGYRQQARAALDALKGGVAE